MGKALVFGTKDCRFGSCQGHAFRNAASVRRSVGLHGRLVQCQFARMVKGLDLRSNASNCAWVRNPTASTVVVAAQLGFVISVRLARHAGPSVVTV